MANSTELLTDIYFGCPIYVINKSEWVNETNKICDDYIKDAYDRKKPFIDERRK